MENAASREEELKQNAAARSEEFQSKKWENQKCYTSGQIAKICQVATRTVGKWIDSGQLVGHRVNRSRRVYHHNLFKFLQEKHMTTALKIFNAYHGILCVCLKPNTLQRIRESFEKTREILSVVDLFDFGVHVDEPWRLIIIDAEGLGKTETQLGLLKVLERKKTVIVLVPDDVSTVKTEGVDYGEIEMMPVSGPIESLIEKIEGWFVKEDGLIKRVSDINGI